MAFVLLPDASAIDLLDPLATDMPPDPHNPLLSTTTLSKPAQSSGFFSYGLFSSAQRINIWQMEQLTEMLFDLFILCIYFSLCLVSLSLFTFLSPLSTFLSHPLLTLIVSFAQIKIMLNFLINFLIKPRQLFESCGNLDLPRNLCKCDQRTCWQYKQNATPPAPMEKLAN